jgi:hypothetical protein
MAELALRGRDMHASMFSTSGLPLRRWGGESVAAEEAADFVKVSLKGVVGSWSRSERLLVVITVDVEAADASEARDDADASESSDGRRMRSFTSSSSCVLNVVVVVNEAVEVAALPQPSRINGVHRRFRTGRAKGFPTFIRLQI